MVAVWEVVELRGYRLRRAGDPELVVRLRTCPHCISGCCNAMPKLAAIDLKTAARYNRQQLLPIISIPENRPLT